MPDAHFMAHSFFRRLLFERRTIGSASALYLPGHIFAKLDVFKSPAFAGHRGSLYMCHATAPLNRQPRWTSV